MEGRKQQVPPLRYASVGMTILLQGQVLLAEALAGTAELSSRPKRSEVEGPAVSFPGSADDDARHCQLQDLAGEKKVGRLLAALAVKSCRLAESYDVFDLCRVDHVLENALAE